MYIHLFDLNDLILNMHKTNQEEDEDGSVSCAAACGGTNAALNQVI